MHIAPVKIAGRASVPHKSVKTPLLDSRTVLTNSPWTFVSLWLKRHGKAHAQFYWEQAWEFHKVSTGLPAQSAPLLLYYCFMNATKALLAAKGIPFGEKHGVGEWKRPNLKKTFTNEAVTIYSNGILPSLSNYYGEAETSRTHSLQQLLFNMVFIHRTYCLTYTSQKEMFLPLANCGYVYDRRTKDVFFAADVEKNIPLRPALRRLPSTFVADPSIGERTIRSVAHLNWRRPGRPSDANVSQLSEFNHTLRSEVQYINGARALWYLRLPTAGPGQIKRQLPTLILAAMHRLSEICRYHPLQLDALLAGQKNWLLTEFIQMSAVQFIDEIASEVTGYQFLIPNVREAK